MDELDFKKRAKWAIDYVCTRDKLTNKSLGESLGFKGSTVGQYRSKRIKPPIKFTSPFCRLYRINETWLFSGEGEPFPGARVVYPEVCGPVEEHIDKADDQIQSKEGVKGYPSDKIAGVSEGETYPAHQKSSFDLAKAVELAVRVLGSGTSYAYALYLNITHFERAITAESRLDVLEEKCKSLEQSVKELQRQLNLMRKAREQSEDLDPAAGQESA
jgi:hypothetical protein